MLVVVPRLLLLLLSSAGDLPQQSRLRRQGAKGERGICPIRHSALRGGIFGLDWRPVCVFFSVLWSCTLHFCFGAGKNLQTAASRGCGFLGRVVCPLPNCVAAWARWSSKSRAQQPKKQQNSRQKVPIAARLLMPRAPRRWAKAWVAWVCLDALIAKGPPQGPPAKGCQGPPSRIPRRRLLCSARYARLVPTTPRYQPNTVSFRSRTRASAGRASLQAHPAQCVQRCWSPAVCGSALCWESLQSQCGLRVCVGAWHGCVVAGGPSNSPPPTSNAVE